ncbi:pol-like protein [Gracilaria domingensis]|nr:pol-like protein [Gracilaria domingensis]
MWKHYSRNPTESNRMALQQAKEHAKAIINKMKKETWKGMVGKLRPDTENAKLWEITKSIERGSKDLASLCPPDGETWFDKKRAHWFLRTEINQVRDHTKETVMRNLHRKALGRYRRESQLSHGVEKEVFQMHDLELSLAGMNCMKAAGPDEVQIAFLQHLPDLGKKWLLNLINRSYCAGETPARWRLARLIPIPKPGVRGKFRPISLISVVARLAERMVNRAFMAWLEPQLPSCQAGFRMNRTTEEHVAALTTQISDGWQVRRDTLAAFFDFSKAYDCVQHHRLMVKLSDMGCTTQLWRWIRSFVMDRRWTCRWNTADTGPHVVPQGLPQGGTLSPGLWIAYISDLPQEVISADRRIDLSLFADDVAMWATQSKLEICKGYLQAAIERLEQYCQENNIVLNPRKTKAAQIYEKAMRVPKQSPTPLVKALQNEVVEGIRLSRSTIRKAAESRLAEAGLLQLPRAPLPQEPGLYHAGMVYFHMSACTKEDPIEIQREQALKAIENLPNANCEIWTDGSVGTPDWINSYRPNRASVEWDEKYYTGTVYYSDAFNEYEEFVELFAETHGHCPHIVMKYDDGFFMAYELETSSNQQCWS